MISNVCCRYKQSKLIVNPGSLLPKLCTMDGYTSILLLISVAFICHGQDDGTIDVVDDGTIDVVDAVVCERRCRDTCRRTWPSASIRSIRSIGGQ